MQFFLYNYYYYYYTPNKCVDLTRAARYIVYVVDYPEAASDKLFEVRCVDTCFQSSTPLISLTKSYALKLEYFCYTSD